MRSSSPPILLPDDPAEVERIRARFLAMTRRDETTGCLIWTGAKHNVKGYGYFTFNKPVRMMRGAHRASYVLFVGPIPDGHDIEHRCHTDDPTCTAGNACPHRPCVEPSHLEPVSHRENVLRSPHTLTGRQARQTHCKFGHEFTLANTKRMPNGGRACRVCVRRLNNEYRSRKRKKARLTGA